MNDPISIAIDAVAYVGYNLANPIKQLKGLYISSQNWKSLKETGQVAHKESDEFLDFGDFRLKRFEKGYASMA